MSSLLQDEGSAWEMASLKMRSTTLAAENEALRGHVQHLQDVFARLERNVQVWVINEVLSAS
jgi:hypothetical protein